MKKFLSDVLIDCGLTVNGTASFGTATATTVATSDNSTNIATTAWVKSLGYSTTDSYISGVSLIGNSLSFTGINSAFTGTIDLSSIVTVPVVETVYETVKNTSGNTIYKGTPLAVVAGQTEGFISDVVPADASDPTKMPALFIANEDMAPEAEGEAVVFGSFSGVDTSLYQSGTVVYVAAGGGWTDTKPVWPNKIQNLGVITKSHPSNGGGIVTGVGRANDIPNLTAGKIWVGTANYPIESTTVHIDEANSRLGVGTTSPGAKLHVSGGEIRVDAGQAVTLDTSNNMYLVGASSQLRIYNGGNPVVNITTGGNVGIGTTSPAVKLEIKTATSDTTSVEGLRLYNAGGGVGAGVKIGLGVGATYSEKAYLRTDIISGGAGRLFIGVNGTDKVRIDNNDVEINGARLYVNSGGPTNIIYPALFVMNYIETTAFKASYSGNVNGGYSGGYTSSNSVNNTAVLARVSSTSGIINYAEYGINNLNGFVIGQLGDAAVKGIYGSDSLEFITASSTRAVITSDGNVGIGTTSPGQKLEVNGNIKLSSTVGATATPSYIWLGNDFSDGTTKDKLKIYLYNDGADERYGFSVGNIADVQYHSNVYHDFYTSNSLSLRIDGSGNVGIGTTPNQGVRLQVSGAVDVWNSLNTLLRLEHDGTRGLIQSYTGGGYSSTAISPYGGNVGIGTDSPSYKLDVVGQVRLSDNLYVGGNKTSGATLIQFNNYDAALVDQDDVQNIIQMNGRYWSGDNSQIVKTEIRSIKDSSNGNGGSALGFATQTGGSAPAEHMRITKSGNIGIGTTVPTSPGGFNKIVHINGGYASLVLTSTIPSKTWEIGVNAASLLTFYDGVADRLVINSSGNVGIGTTNPLHKLQVNGNISILGGTYLDFANGDVRFVNSSGLLSIQTYSVSTGLTTKMVVTGAGNVGIGTDSPSAESNLSLAAKGVSEGGHLTLFKGIGNSHATHIDNYSDSFRIMYGTDSSSAAVQFMLTHGNGNVAIGGFTPAEKLHISGNIRIDGSSTAVILQTGDKTASGSGAVFATYDTTATYGAVVDYVVYDSDRNNMRTGTFTAVWNTNETNYNDVSTVDIGDTSTVTLTSQINGADVELIVTGDTQYTIKFNVKLIK